MLKDMAMCDNYVFGLSICELAGNDYILLVVFSE
jgi:hypothetical protein